jgi:hypothetical protein
MRPAKPSGPYSVAARRFHWWTVAFLAVQVPVGLVMVYRGKGLNVWDATTNALYSGHKLLGLIILCVVIARLIYRLTQGAPADEPTLEPWQKGVSHATHWTLYLLLIVVPIGGYIGISLYPALDVSRRLAAGRGVSQSAGGRTRVVLAHARRLRDRAARRHARRGRAVSLCHPPRRRAAAHAGASGTVWELKSRLSAALQ